jgi:S-adenosyl methyltransferase
MQAKIDTSKPHAARMYDYLLGGKDHFAVDRATAERAIAAIPTGRTAARENRAFLGRAVRYRTGGRTARTRVRCPKRSASSAESPASSDSPWQTMILKPRTAALCRTKLQDHGTRAARGYRGGAIAWGELSGTAPGWPAASCRVSGPRRISTPATTAPQAKIAADHQNAVV